MSKNKFIDIQGLKWAMEQAKKTKVAMNNKHKFEPSTIYTKYITDKITKKQTVEVIDARSSLQQIEVVDYEQGNESRINQDINKDGQKG